MVVFERSASNREKKVDTQLAADVIADSYDGCSRAETRCVAGDTNYVPVIEKLQARGFSCIVVFWDHASRELKEAASEFISLDPRLDELRREA